jgi:hypothetical protein
MLVVYVWHPIQITFNFPLSEKKGSDGQKE